jgi:hypothetical protein
MKMDRLLTVDEIKNAPDNINLSLAMVKHCTEDRYFPNSTKVVELSNRAIIEAQDTKTLKAVGEWLDNIHWSDYDIDGLVILLDYAIKDFKNGKMPEIPL